MEKENVGAFARRKKNSLRFVLNSMQNKNENETKMRENEKKNDMTMNEFRRYTEIHFARIKL